MAAPTPPHLDRSTIADLQKTPLFLRLPEDDLRMLLAESRIETRGEGEPLFERGGAAERFFVVLSGHVELFVEHGGRRSVLEIAQRPALLGEAALLTGGTHPNSARVVDAAKLLIVPAGAFLTALDERVDLAMLMLCSMSQRLRGLVSQIARLKQKSTAQRLAGFLLGLTSAASGPVVVRFPYDKRLAAESLGMSAESLSRALVRLAELGVESRDGNVVSISDVAVLRAFGAEEAE